MRLPTLLLISLALPAVEVAPGLSVGGWGEAFARGEVRQANNPKHPTNRAVGETDRSVDFNADAAFKLAYHVDRFRLRVDVLVYDEPPFATSDSNVLLEQAFIDFEQNASVSWRGGRFQTTWLGWEGFHTADLWRVNHSAAWDWNVQNHSLKPNKPFVSDGVGMLTRTPDGVWGAEFYIVDDLLGDGDTTRGSDKALGASFSARRSDLGRIELGLGYDPRAVTNGTAGGDSHAFAIDLNADVTAWHDRGWFFAAEAQWHQHQQLAVGPILYGNDLILLAMANYAFDEVTSFTLMVDYVERGFSAPDNELIEYAAAILTRPHDQVRLNAEVFWWDEQAAQADAWGAAAVINVALP